MMKVQTEIFSGLPDIIDFFSSAEICQVDYVKFAGVLKLYCIPQGTIAKTYLS